MTQYCISATAHRGAPLTVPDGPTQPTTTHDFGESPADYYESCKHCAACAMQYERWVEPIDTDGFAWIDRLAESMGCAECAEWDSQ